MKTFRFVMGFVMLAGVLACGSGGGHGTLKVAMTDAPFPAIEGCLDAAVVRIESVEMRLEGGGFELVDLPEGQAVELDLLDLRNGLSRDVATGSLPTGAYDQVRLVLSQSVLQFADGSARTFKVPSGSSSGIKINVTPSLLIAANQTTSLLLDVDISRSFHLTGSGGEPTCDDLKDAAGKAIFQPLVRALNLDATGILSGTITDGAGAPAADIEVSVRPAGADAQTDAVAVTLSSPAGLTNAPEGSYAVHVDAGTWDVWVRPQGQDAAFKSLSAIPVAAKQIASGNDIVLP